jgi:hypothetical protein
MEALSNGKAKAEKPQSKSSGASLEARRIWLNGKIRKQNNSDK